MDSKLLLSCSDKEIEKLNKITKRIQKARKNTKLAEKEAFEFQEIHKLLECTGKPNKESFFHQDSSRVYSLMQDDLEEEAIEPESPTKECKSSEDSIVPVKSPGLKVFHEELVYSLFNEKKCLLKNFINPPDKCLIFGKNESIPTEECFRKLIAYHVTENLMPDEGSCSSISLYVLYLMSVHQNLDFVAACFDFLTFQKFLIRPEDLFPIFINFGAKREDLFEFREQNFLDKFPTRDDREIPEKTEFPFFNVEMVGRILLQYITDDLLVIDSNVKSLVKGLVKITLDPKIRSGSLLSLFSTILTAICARLQKNYSLREILDWVYPEGEHLLNQLEVCRNVSKPIFADLHDGLVFKIFSQILKLRSSSGKPPIKINHVKLVLKKLRSRELSPLELYALLRLINSSLPGLTATVKDSTEVNVLLAALEQKISKNVDSVDLIRLKLEIAKVGNLVTNNVNNRFAGYESPEKSSVKKVKCSN